MKKLCMWLAFALVCLSFGAMAETVSTPLHFSGDFTYILLPDGTAQIVDWEGTDESLSIPSAFDGYAVTSISECAFAGCETLSAVRLPDTIREIGERAFAGCSGLMRVSLPEGLERMGDRAFSRCEALTAIALPRSLSQVGANPFERCANLNNIRVSPDQASLSVIDGVLFSVPDQRLICYPSGRDAQRYAVPEGIKTIGAMAFDRNLYLEEIVLPNSLSSIERDAFYGCAALLSMNMPAGVDAIGADALERCSRLTLTVQAQSYAESYARGMAIACVSDSVT